MARRVRRVGNVPRALALDSTPIDWGSPLLRGLLAMQVGDRLYVPGQAPETLFIASGAPTVEAGKSGAGLKFASGYQAFQSNTSWSNVDTGPFTLEVLCAITSAPSLAGFATYTSGGSGQARGLIAYGGAGSKNIYFWGDSADLASGVDWREDGQAQHVFVTSGGSGTTMRFYRDGVEIASGSTPTLNSASTGKSIRIGDAGAAWASSPTGSIFKSSIYRRELSAGEVAELTCRPIPTFRRRAAISASSLPTLSAATYVPGSITATGFRPRVTAT